MRRAPRSTPALLVLVVVLRSPLAAASPPAQEEQGPYPPMPPGRPPAVAVEGADAAEEAEMRRYVERVPGVDAPLAMVPIPGGTFRLGSPESEPERKAAEGPQVEVRVEPFWMAETETTWDLYQPYMLKLDRERRAAGGGEVAPQDAWADAVSRPTPPYVPMDFEMGVEGYPAICMTQLAAKQFTKWLSLKTGRFYRLPTEAEWEYACRAGTTSAYSFGDDPAELDRYAWHYGNSADGYHPVGAKEPNPWGLHDMHGNVAEWVLDAYDRDAYAKLEAGVVGPITWPTERYPRVVRGGSWDDDPDRLRSAARRGSSKGWKVQDPQLPKSVWYHTDARWVGFRVVRPLRVPPPEEQLRYWEPDLDEDRAILERQRRGER